MPSVGAAIYYTVMQRGCRSGTGNVRSRPVFRTVRGSGAKSFGDEWGQLLRIIHACVRGQRAPAWGGSEGVAGSWGLLVRADRKHGTVARGRVGCGGGGGPAATSADYDYRANKVASNSPTLPRPKVPPPKAKAFNYDTVYPIRTAAGVGNVNPPRRPSAHSGPHHLVGIKLGLSDIRFPECMCVIMRNTCVHIRTQSEPPGQSFFFFIIVPLCHYFFFQGFHW